MAIDLKKYQIKEDDLFIVDTCILIDNFFPIPPSKVNERILSDYSSFLQNLISKQTKILLPCLVVSEFINRFIKGAFELWKSANPERKEANFKLDYRGTATYQNQLKILENILKNINKFSTQIDDQFSKCLLENQILSLSEMDFTDRYLLEIAKKHNAKILTRDSDFKIAKSLDVQVITTHPAILN